MLDPQDGQKQLPGLNVYDAFVIVQIVDRLLRVGGVTGREIAHVASLRTRVINAAKAVSGVDIDTYKAEPPTEAKADG